MTVNANDPVAIVDKIVAKVVDKIGHQQFCNDLFNSQVWFVVISVWLLVNILFVDQQVTSFYGNITSSLIDPI